MPAVLPSTIDPLEQHEIPPEYNADAIQVFIAWCTASEGAEMANAQKIFGRLCQILSVPEPDLKRVKGDNRYIFEEDVKEGKAHRRIDVYKRGALVFEAKQGVNPATPGEASELTKPRAGHTRTVRGAGVRGSIDWVDSMRAGRHQAGNYSVHVTERGDPKPPFVIVADVGHCFWIWSSFSRDARDDYGDFEVLAAFRWEELLRPEVFKLLRQIWLEPEALNEEARGQRVTAEIADKVCRLATRLEKRFHPEAVGDFLMKCVFTMFAEDVGFLPIGLFTERLTAWLEQARSDHEDRFVRGLRSLWIRMREGGDLDTGHEIRRFNGYLFHDPEPLALDAGEMEELLAAAKADWRKVSPAIFGTLLERALSNKKRQRLGAHYTPEAYIRRLIEKTILVTLRREWRDARADMEKELRTGADDNRARERALAIGHAFRKRLTSTTVLDPACGSGNFLYVALKELKRLEGEVVRALQAIGDKQTWLDLPGETVHPAQFFGIEVESWASKIAELVLWIGYLQWQVSARRIERMPPPILQDLRHIENADALIIFDQIEGVYGEDSRPMMRARGVTDKKAKREMMPVTRYVGVRRAKWPAAEFIVGNPPFLGNKRLNDVLDPGYVEAIKGAYPEVPGAAELVMYWWWRCAELLHQAALAEAAAKLEATKEGRAGTKGPRKKLTKQRPRGAAGVSLRCFGLVTTNSITQQLNRPVIAEALEKKGIELAYAIPDHPWYDEGAAVRIAMTVGARAGQPALLGKVTDERKTKAADLDSVKVTDVPVATIHSDLAAGADVRTARRLRANQQLTFQGVNPVGNGFVITPEEMAELGYSAVDLPSVLRRYISGKDLSQRTEERYIVDFRGEDPKSLQQKHPRLWERIVRLVKPQRDRQNDRQREERWWLFGRSSGELAAATRGLSRYIGTCRTSKHRLFSFVGSDVIPNTEVVVVTSDRADVLSVLSSRVHLAWVGRTKGMLEDRPRYNHTETFEPFPFPSLEHEQRVRLAELGEQLDRHRKDTLRASPSLRLTDAYNVVEKLRAGGALTLTDEDERIRDMALADTLRDIHDQIDRAALASYGWPSDLSDEEIVARLVALNAERAGEEQHGVIRWLRPDFQSGSMQTALLGTQMTKQDEDKPTKRQAARALHWPPDMPSRIQMLTAALREHRRAAGEEPLSAAAVAGLFKGAKLDEVELTLYCAAAADAVARVETETGGTAWMARVT